MSKSRQHNETPAPNLYFDRYFDMEAVKILPGEYYATARPMLIVTVLGSCVAVCIRDRINGIGGMNNFMLPSAGSLIEPCDAASRYGSYAMTILLNELLKMGARRQHLEAKLFGGGHFSNDLTTSNAGARNAEFVRNYLKLEKIPVIAEDLLDIYPRKIYFFPNQGAVMVKKLVRLNNNTIIRREQEHNTRLYQEKIIGDDADLC